jgi:DNA repair ATPase RecN
LLSVKPSFVSKWHLVARTFYQERKPLSDQADLEKKTIEALRQYRKALASVESREQAEASAQRALTGMLPDLERAILEDCALSAKDNLVRTGLAAVSRSNEAWDALSEATTILEAARQALVALEQQLGYIPGVSRVAAYSRAIRHSPNSG